MQVLGGLDAETFLRRHWQKRPLLVRQAFPGFADPVSPARLARLACREDVDSRLVLVRGGPRPYTVVDGPQDPARLRRLPERDWTLLVHEVDRHVAAAGPLLAAFDFIPRWRRDDLLVSVAAPGGGVGPHVDAYDVFLVQGRGRRRWQVAQGGGRALRRGLDLAVLRRFVPEAEWVLEPGDLLYLPPGLAHHGVALEECLTYSVGFRAPAVADLVAHAARAAARTVGPGVLYGDPGRRPARDPALLEDEVVRALRALVDGALAGLDRGAFAELVGELVTEPRHGVPPLRPATEAHVARGLATGRLVRRPGARCAHTPGASGTLLFAEGRTIRVPRALSAWARRAAAGDPHPSAAERAAPHALRFVRDLVRSGAFAIVAGDRRPRRAGARGRPRSPRAAGSR